MYQIVSICYNHLPTWTKHVASSCRGLFQCRDALYRTRSSSPPLKCVPSVDARRNAGSPRPFPDLGRHQSERLVKPAIKEQAKNDGNIMMNHWNLGSVNWFSWENLQTKTMGFAFFVGVSTPILMFIHLWGFQHHNNAFHTWANGNSESTVESLAAGLKKNGSWTGPTCSTWCQGKSMGVSKNMPIGTKKSNGWLSLSK